MAAVVAQDEMETVRRRNLETLTAEQGAKLALAQVMGWSPANVTHFLSGKHHFRAHDAELFCRVLALPADWFESPQK